MFQKEIRVPFIYVSSLIAVSARPFIDSPTLWANIRVISQMGRTIKKAGTKVKPLLQILNCAHAGVSMISEWFSRTTDSGNN